MLPSLAQAVEAASSPGATTRDVALLDAYLGVTNDFADTRSLFVPAGGAWSGGAFAVTIKHGAGGAFTATTVGPDGMRMAIAVDDSGRVFEVVNGRVQHSPRLTAQLAADRGASARRSPTAVDRPLVAADSDCVFWAGLCAMLTGVCIRRNLWACGAAANACAQAALHCLTH